MIQIYLHFMATVFINNSVEHDFFGFFDVAAETIEVVFGKYMG